MSKKKEELEDLLTAKEVAQWLGVSEKTVRRWQHQGKLPCVKLNGWAVRFKRCDVEAFIERGYRPKKDN